MQTGHTGRRYFSKRSVIKDRRSDLSVLLFLIGIAHNPWHQKTVNHCLSFYPCQVWHVCFPLTFSNRDSHTKTQTHTQTPHHLRPVKHVPHSVFPLLNFTHCCRISGTPRATPIQTHTYPTRQDTESTPRLRRVKNRSPHILWCW